MHNHFDILPIILGREGEGWFDPWQLIRALRRKNINMGVHYIDGEVKKFRYSKEYTMQGEVRIERDILEGVDVCCTLNTDFLTQILYCQIICEFLKS